jgi:hypothetical protein
MSELLKINVNDHTERKNGLSYLSWAWAWSEVLKVDPLATWTPMFNGPQGSESPWFSLPDGSMLVGVSVVIKQHAKQCMLPVMDHRNKAIKNPDAFAVNTALMRCLAKCIAMHGLGLYIYAGEDLPEADTDPEPARPSRPIKATDGAGAGITDDRKAEIEELALYLVDCHKSNNDMEAFRIWYAADTFNDNDERVYCWSLLGAESKLRAAIKANKPEERKAA